MGQGAVKADISKFKHRKYIAHSSLLCLRQTSLTRYIFLFNSGFSFIICNNSWLHKPVSRGGMSRQILFLISEMATHYFIYFSSSQNFRKILFKCFSFTSVVSWESECRFRWPYLGRIQNSLEASAVLQVFSKKSQGEEAWWLIGDVCREHRREKWHVCHGFVMFKFENTA